MKTKKENQILDQRLKDGSIFVANREYIGRASDGKAV